MDTELEAVLDQLGIARQARVVPVVPRPSRYVMLTAHGITKTRAEWARDAGLSEDALRKRLDRGMTPEQAVRTPSRPKRR